MSTAPVQTRIDAGVLAGRVVLIAGAHGGLGSAVAHACTTAGASMVLLGRKVPRLKRLQDALLERGGDAVLYPLDLEGASPDDYAEMAQRIADEFGRLDGVLHCAADFHGLTPLLHTDPAAFARAVHVNLTAAWWLSQACLPLLAKAPDASLVLVVDDLARTTGAYWGGYGIAQQGRSALIDMLHQETRHSSVRVHGYQPRPMRTALRARAYATEQDQQAHDPAQAAADCVHLLSAAGSVDRGRIRVASEPT